MMSTMLLISIFCLNIDRKKVTCVERENNYNNINDDNNSFIARYNLNMKYQSNYKI
jgi:hypothetical protein